jgi:hypothetical protein
MKRQPLVAFFCKQNSINLQGVQAMLMNKTNLLLMVLTLAMSANGRAAESDEATVVFATSCADEVSKQFNYALTMLHSFEYPESDKIFKAILQDDPNCAMAYWGMAMSLWHPLWTPPSASELQLGLEALSVANKLPKSAREGLYIQSLLSFYQDYQNQTHQVRAKKYERAMESVYQANLNDTEAAIFYALALLATVDPKDKTYLQQYKAAAILNWVKSSNPRHPGVLHYLIHSYDYPGLAHLALAEAKIYAKAAPDSAHAQHMPSHIFTRLGLWQESIASNVDSTRSAAAYTHSAHLPGHYDEGFHSIDYLMYALLQCARDKEALSLLQSLQALGPSHPENFKVAFTLASSPARYALERQQWQEAANLILLRSDNFPWQNFAWARSIHHFARGIGAARSGNTVAAKVELDALKTIQSNLSADTLPYWREQVSVQVDALFAWIEYGEGRIEQALQIAQKAADREDAVDKHPVTPGEVIPARELYADMLYSANRYQDALFNYQIELQHSPNKHNALLGAARSAKALNDSETTFRFYKMLKQQIAAGDADNSRESNVEIQRYLEASANRQR